MKATTTAVRARTTTCRLLVTQHDLKPWRTDPSAFSPMRGSGGTASRTFDQPLRRRGSLRCLDSRARMDRPAPLPCFRCSQARPLLKPVPRMHACEPELPLVTHSLRRHWQLSATYGPVSMYFGEQHDVSIEVGQRRQDALAAGTLRSRALFQVPGS
jgi:hypothetical protein